MKHRISNRARCPHYISEDTRAIRCGMMGETGYVHLTFTDQSKAKLYKLTRCQSCFEDCPIHQMLEEKNEKI